MTNKAQAVLAAIKPPKSVLFTEDMSGALEACPLLKDLSSLEELPFNAGVKSALSSIYDAFVDNGLDDILAEVTMDRLQLVEEKIKDGMMEGLLQALPNLKTVIRAKDPFAVGIVLGFGTVYDLLQDEPAIPAEEDEGEEAEDQDEDLGEALTAMASGHTPPKRPVGRPGGPVDIISMLGALQGAGISLKRIQVVPEASDSGAIGLAIQGTFRAPVRFSDVAKINAIFKMVDPDSDLELSALEDDAELIRFSYRVG